MTDAQWHRLAIRRARHARRERIAKRPDITREYRRAADARRLRRG